MITMETKPKPVISTHIECAAQLVVEREDISFTTINGDKVAICVTITNAGEEPSTSQPVFLQSAPLGAFVPWRPLKTLRLPPLEPGESHQLTTIVSRPHPETLGSFNRLPPKRLITALSSEDQPQPEGVLPMQKLFDLFLKSKNREAATVMPEGKLALDAWDLLGRRQLHWAGNINVFVGRKSVERHVAKALRIYPGHLNFAMLVVGDWRSDAYAFRAKGLAPDWTAVLSDSFGGTNLLSELEGVNLLENEWVKSRDIMLLKLMISPPEDCDAGKLDLHVTQQSSGKTAIVEFDLDPSAQGPGCYSF